MIAKANKSLDMGKGNALGGNPFHAPLCRKGVLVAHGAVKNATIYEIKS